MSNYTLDELKGLAYNYANEDKATYVVGTTLYSKQLNKATFEKLSAFLNWVEATNKVVEIPKKKKS